MVSALFRLSDLRRERLGYGEAYHIASIAPISHWRYASKRQGGLQKT